MQNRLGWLRGRSILLTSHVCHRNRCNQPLWFAFRSLSSNSVLIEADKAIDSTPASHSTSKIIHPIEINLSRPPPLTTSSFSAILDDCFPFVDKTAIIGSLFQLHDRVFLARPRKWGKSTLLSTMKMILEGGQENREKLKDLNIVKRSSEYPSFDWKERPVLLFDFSSVDDNAQTRPFRRSLMDLILSMGKTHGIDLERFDHGKNLKFLWFQCLEELSRQHGAQVSVLVDEYDAPIVNALDSDSLDNEKMNRHADENRKVLRDFFTVLKAQNAKTFRCFTTGVNKFSMDGLSSGSNDFMDVSFDRWYSYLCGYTWKEMMVYYPQQLEELCAELNCNMTNLEALLTRLYGGYSWSGENKFGKMFNPWDINNCLAKKDLDYYWTETAVSAHLSLLLKSESIQDMSWKQRKYPLSRLESLVDVAGFIDETRIDSTRLLTLSGYLTIKSYRHEDEEEWVTLGFPNATVSKYFSKQFLSFVLQAESFPISDLAQQVSICLGKDHPILCALYVIQGSLQCIPHSDAFLFDERRIYAILYHIFVSALGSDGVEAEGSAFQDRIALHIKTGTTNHVIELKVVKQVDQKPSLSSPLGEHGKRTRRTSKRARGTPSNLTSEEMNKNPRLRSPKLQEAIDQLTTRNYKNVASTNATDKVRLYAVVYSSNLVMLDAVEIDDAGKVLCSLWDPIVMEPLSASVAVDASNSGEEMTEKTEQEESG